MAKVEKWRERGGNCKKGVQADKVKPTSRLGTRKDEAQDLEENSLQGRHPFIIDVFRDVRARHFQISS
jgi:hypothetical protein